MRIPKSPHFPFYDFSTIFYDFTKFNKYLSQIRKNKILKPKQASWATTVAGPPRPKNETEGGGIPRWQAGPARHPQAE
jgi:hypothetical protein